MSRLSEIEKDAGRSRSREHLMSEPNNVINLREVEEAILDMFLCKKRNGGLFPTSEQKMMHLKRIENLAEDIGASIAYSPGLLVLCFSQYSLRYHFSDDRSLIKDHIIIGKDGSHQSLERSTIVWLEGR